MQKLGIRQLKVQRNGEHHGFLSPTVLSQFLCDSCRPAHLPVLGSSNKDTRAVRGAHLKGTVSERNKEYAGKRDDSNILCILFK